ncbi:MAG: hypothetical protein KKC68_06530 [Candidatus Thermoplasmatota archaeon]|nr:hypothetical protein [Candidatus Thermoplasmatota archaeon]MBU1941415.1 hypothetical protein [Candidatus Thermoplasmatota archaeon]
MVAILSDDVIAWIWVQDEKLIKAIYHKKHKTLVIFDEHDEVLLKREGVDESQIKKIEILFLNCGAQRMDST